MFICNFSEFSRLLNVRTYNNFPLTKIIKSLFMGIWDFMELVNNGVLFIHQKINHWWNHISWLKLHKLRYSKANLRNLHRKNFMHVLHRMLYITLLFMIHRPNEDPNSKIVIIMRTLQTQDPKPQLMKFWIPKQGWEKFWLWKTCVCIRLFYTNNQSVGGMNSSVEV